MAPKGRPKSTGGRPPKSARSSFPQTPGGIRFPLGCVLDVTYGDPPNVQTWRVRVVNVDPVKGWHHVDSKGLSLWDGEDFKDVIDVDVMWEEGRIRMVPLEEVAGSPHQGLTQRPARGHHPHPSAASPSSAAAPAAVLGTHGPGPSFGAELIGQVLDVTYNMDKKGARRYKVRVSAYDRAHGWHAVESAGLSQWDGADFTDTLDIGQMYAEGEVEFVEPLVPGLVLPGGLRSARPKATAKRRSHTNKTAPTHPPVVAGAVGGGSSGSQGSRARKYGAEVIGSIVDLTYNDPTLEGPNTFRVQVVKYLADDGLHVVNSKGLSRWEGETFTDQVRLDQMAAAGQVSWVSKPPVHKAPSGAAPPVKRPAAKKSSAGVRAKTKTTKKTPTPAAAKAAAGSSRGRGRGRGRGAAKAPAKSPAVAAAPAGAAAFVPMSDGDGDEDDVSEMAESLQAQSPEMEAEEEAEAEAAAAAAAEAIADCEP
eukprot:TRINITY_DN2722_c0_g1_i1.p1 TRINITY_DN2722_c0_g1~~TRINITY_DN2722_c0_g1_i1.p1  ORF type:complete len:479 (-),score=79.30 TRINITY_DN2722_c0_g1_i1:67-1503(-)